jgi:tetratricopeptide (TPR) repeat protein
MPNQATVPFLPPFAIAGYESVDLSTLPKNYSAKKRESAEIINFEIAEKTYRVAQFSRAIECDPESPLAWYNRGRAHVDQAMVSALVVGEFDRAINNAIKDFTKAINLKHVPSYNARASARLYVGGTSAALRDFSTTLSLVPEAVDSASRELIAVALFHKAFLLKEQGNRDEAVVTINELIHRFDGSATEAIVRKEVAAGFRLLGNILAEQGDYEQARAVWRRCSEIYPEGSAESAATERAGGDPTFEHLDADFSGKAEVVNVPRVGKLLVPPPDDLQKQYYRQLIKFNKSFIRLVENKIEAFILEYYNLSQEQQNPSNGYDLPKRVITEAELREYIKKQASLLTKRLSQVEEQPFPILPERTVNAIVAHGKKYPWDERKDRGWPYHTNAFVYVHITYRKWVNLGLTREMLAWADPALHAHLKTKISREGLPGWLDVPSGPEARARAIVDPTKRAELEIARRVLRDRTRKHRASLGD